MRTARAAGIPVTRAGDRRHRSVTMPYRRFGATGLEVSEVGFGAWAIGGKAYGSVDNAESLRALARAQELGCNLVDTAMVYGESEVVLGQFLKGRRNRWILATKYSYQPAGIDGDARSSSCGGWAPMPSISTSCIRCPTEHRTYEELYAAEEGPARSASSALRSIRLMISTRPSMSEFSTACSFPSACWIRILLSFGSSSCARADLRS